MRRVIEGVTLETLFEVIRRQGVRPGQKFAIMLDEDETMPRPDLRALAEQLREEAFKKGITAEIFGTIMGEEK